MSTSNSTVSGVRYKSLRFMGYPDYLISSEGIVLSGKRADWHPRVPVIMKSGHFRVGLLHDGKTAKFLVHRLMLLAFVGPCPEGMECCHADGNPSNNRLENLRWGTREDNKKDSKRHGTLPIGEKVGISRLTEHNVRKIRFLFETGKYKKTELGIMFGVNYMTIHAVLIGITWKHVV